MSVYKKIGSGAALMMSVGCTDVPKEASPLTEEERLIIDGHMEHFEQVEPVVARLWSASSINFNNQFEEQSPLESSRILRESADHFYVMLEDERIYGIAAPPEGHNPYVGGLTYDRKQKDDDKDFILLVRPESRWGPDLYLHEATHSLQRSELPEGFAANGHPDYDSNVDVRIQEMIAAKDMPTIIGDFYDEIDRIFERTVFNEDVLSGRLYEVYQSANPEGFADLVVDEGYAHLLDGFGVAEEESRIIFAEYADYLQDLQRERKAELDAAREADSERRRSEGGMARR